MYYIFLDELDALASSRNDRRGDSCSDENNRVVTELNEHLDGFESASAQYFVIAATNLIQNLDEAIKRRFDEKLLVTLPDITAKKQIVKNWIKPLLNKEFCNLSTEELAAVETIISEETDGYSGKDINSICKKALQLAILDKAKLSKDYFQKALPLIHSSINEKHIKEQEQYYSSKTSSITKYKKKPVPPGVLVETSTKKDREVNTSPNTGKESKQTKPPLFDDN